MPSGAAQAFTASNSLPSAPSDPPEDGPKPARWPHKRHFDRPGHPGVAEVYRHRCRRPFSLAESRQRDGMSYYEVLYRFPGGSSVVGERILAGSASEAAAAFTSRGLHVVTVRRL